MAEREALLTCLREQWRATGLSTAPVDEATAREAVRSLYRASGEPPPKAVLVLPSPLACLLARGILLALLGPAVCSNVKSTLERSYPPHIRDQLGNEYWAALWGRVWEQLRDQIGSDMWRPLADLQEDPLHRVPAEPISKRIGGRLRHALCTPSGWQWTAYMFDPRFRGELHEQIGRQLGTHLEHELRDQLGGAIDRGDWPATAAGIGSQLKARALWQHNYLMAGQEAAWLAFHEFTVLLGARYDERTERRFDAYRTFARTCGWLFPYKSVAFVSDRPAELSFDVQRRLHNGNGAAVRFRDGWGVHAWHGTRVPAWMIQQRDAITANMIERLTNVEQRRAALEIYGFERYHVERGGRLIASDELHGQPRRVYEITVEGQQGRVIEVVNGSIEPDGSRRKFHLGVVDGVTPAQIIAASYGIALPYYREAVRT